MHILLPIDKDVFTPFVVGKSRPRDDLDGYSKNQQNFRPVLQPPPDCLHKSAHITYLWLRGTMIVIDVWRGMSVSAKMQLIYSSSTWRECGILYVTGQLCTFLELWLRVKLISLSSAVTQ